MANDALMRWLSGAGVPANQDLPGAPAARPAAPGLGGWLRGGGPGSAAGAGLGGGGFQGAEGYGRGPGGPGVGGGSVVDTSGNRLGFEGAFGSVFGNEALGRLAGGMVPGGMLSGLLGRGLRSIAGGPFGVVGWEEVGIGHPQWGAKMAAIREAQRRNRAYARAESIREGLEAGTRSGYRSTAPGRRGARDTGGGAGERGGQPDNGRGGRSGTGGRDASGARE